MTLAVPPSPARHSVFATTQWSVVLNAATDNAQSSRDAFESLYTTYLRPLYAFVRRRGYESNDAMDLVQGFFVHLLESGGLGSVNPEKGRFRLFLLASVKNFIANAHRFESAKKRGGNRKILSLDRSEFEHQYQIDVSDGCSADTLFDRCWLETVLNHVLTELRADYDRAEKRYLFDAIVPYLEGGLPREEVAEHLGMSPAAVAMSLSRMRSRYREILRRTIGETVSSEAGLELELGRLIEIAGRP